MPKKYENKAIHNEDFLKSIINDYPDTYFDWKVTVQFYCALHRCYCVLLTNGMPVEKKHQSNINSIKTIDPDLSKRLFNVYKNSRTSRYDGFINDNAMERINKINYNKSNSELKKIKEIVATHYPIAV